MFVKRLDKCMHFSNTITLTKHTKYKMKLIRHCRPREERASCDHFVEYTTYTPMLTKAKQRDKNNEVPFCEMYKAEKRVGRVSEFHKRRHVLSVNQYKPNALARNDLKSLNRVASGLGHLNKVLS